MKTIFENFREGALIQEAAVGPAELPKNVGIEFAVKGDYITAKYVNMATGENLWDVFGHIWAEKTDFDEGPCLESYSVVKVSAKDGYGPLLYDVVMEIASRLTMGLMPDRYSVTDDAKDVWEFYLNNRPDVKWAQLDDLKNTLTPTPKDNCKQHKGGMLGAFSRKNKMDWVRSPLSKVYRKESQKTLGTLTKLGKLKQVESFNLEEDLQKRSGDEGEHFSVPVERDEFIHFTTLPRARQIIETGKLLMNPPYKKFGTDTVDAISLLYGKYLPTVQTNHIGHDRIVAIKFKTDTVPDIGFPEEVKWKEDVILKNPQVISKQRAVKLLQNTPYNKEVESLDNDYVEYI